MALPNPRFPKLLSPFQIRDVKLKNRMVKPSQSMCLADEGGFVSDANRGFYEAIARGGVGLIVVEHTFPDYPMGVSTSRPIAISEDRFIPGLASLAATIHRLATPCFIQFGHAGPAQVWGLEPDQKPVSSSCLGRTERPHPYYREATELSIGEIEGLVEKYARGAGRARDAGFDGVEIHAAHNYLLNSFMSRAWNKRQDRYGCQDLGSRARIAVEIVRAIKGLVGEGFPVGVRINGAERGIRNGITSEESQSFGKILQEAGADYLSVSAWGFDGYDLLLYPEQVLFPESRTPLGPEEIRKGALVPLAEAVKKNVDIPVITVGRLDAALGETILETGKADLIALGRRLLADPEYPNKVAAGRMEDIAPCTADLECASLIAAGNPIRCRINACLGRENEFPLKPADRKKKVVVIGGGPAGMEAARVAALRGHEVVLYEKERRLGGLLPLAALIKGTEVEDLPAIIAYLETQIRKLGVQVKLGIEADAERLYSEKPDAVILATGGRLTLPAIPGCESPVVLSHLTLHRLAKFFLRFAGPSLLRRLTSFYLPIGQKVVIVGGAIHGCEIGEFLIKRRRKVTILEASEKMGSGIPEMNRKRILFWLAKNGAHLLSGVTYEEISEKGITVITKEGERQTLEADTILLAIPPSPNTELFEALKGKVPEVHLIGDSKEPRDIRFAIDDGFSTAHSLFIKGIPGR